MHNIQKYYFLFKFYHFQYRYSDAIGPDVFYVEEAQETLKHVQKIGVTTLASKWIMSNTRPEVIPYEEHTTTKPSSSITENLFGLIKSSDAQTAASKSNVNPAVNKKPQELPSILKKRSPEESPMISGSGTLQCQNVSRKWKQFDNLSRHIFLIRDSLYLLLINFSL